MSYDLAGYSALEMEKWRKRNEEEMRKKKRMNDGGKVQRIKFRGTAPRFVSWRKVVKVLHAFMVIILVGCHLAPSHVTIVCYPCVRVPEFSGALLARDRIWSSHKVNGWWSAWLHTLCSPETSWYWCYGNSPSWKRRQIVDSVELPQVIGTN